MESPLLPSPYLQIVLCVRMGIADVASRAPKSGSPASHGAFLSVLHTPGLPSAGAVPSGQESLC